MFFFLQMKWNIIPIWPPDSLLIFLFPTNQGRITLFCTLPALASQRDIVHFMVQIPPLPLVLHRIHPPLFASAERSLGDSLPGCLQRNFCFLHPPSMTHHPLLREMISRTQAVSSIIIYCEFVQNSLKLHFRLSVHIVDSTSVISYFLASWDAVEPGWVSNTSD